MSTYAKMRTRRDNWRRKTAETKADLRYQTKEKKRMKRERDHYQEAFRKVYGVGALQPAERQGANNQQNNSELPDQHLA